MCSLGNRVSSAGIEKLLSNQVCNISQCLPFDTQSSSVCASFLYILLFCSAVPPRLGKKKHVYLNIVQKIKLINNLPHPTDGLEIHRSEFLTRVLRGLRLTLQHAELLYLTSCMMCHASYSWRCVKLWRWIPKHFTHTTLPCQFSTHRQQRRTGSNARGHARAFENSEWRENTHHAHLNKPGLLKLSPNAKAMDFLK